MGKKCEVFFLTPFMSKETHQISAQKLDFVKFSDKKCV